MRSAQPTMTPPAAVTGASPSVPVREPSTPAGSRRPSMRGRLERGSLVVAFTAGMAMATPPVEYLGAVVAILASGAGAGVQVSAALMFTLVAFAVAEIPLISYLATPTKTHTVLLQVHDWIRAHRQLILAVVVGVCGVLMAVAGTGV